MDHERQDTDRHATASVAEAAQRLGVTPDAIRSRLHRGTLTGEKVDGAWRIHLPEDDDQPDDRQDATAEPTGERQDATGQATGTDRTRQDAATVDLAPLAETIERLSRRNEELSAAVGMWQSRARHLEEQVQQLTATSESVEAPETPSGSSASSCWGDADEPEGVWARLGRWFRGG